MGETTPKRSLYKPTVNVETDWGEEINDNFVNLDDTIDDLISDLTPELGGDLDTKGKVISDSVGIAIEFGNAAFFGEATLTDGANISWNVGTQPAAKVTLAGNRTLDNPTNMKAGTVYILRVIQDGTGSRTLAYGAAYLFPPTGIPTLTTDAGAIDILTFYCDGTNMHVRGPGSSGSGSDIEIKEDNVQVIAVAVALDFGTGIDVTDEGGNEVAIVVDPAEVDHDALLNFVAAEHLLVGAIDHDALLNFVVGEHFTMLDEDTLVSDSNTQAATQQSIKAYVDAQTGQLTQEEVEDFVGGMVTGNTETLITVTYQDADGTIDFVVNESSINHDALTNFVAGEHLLTAAIDHDALLNFVADEHVAHAGVILTAGVGLSGGGDISVSRSFAIDLNELTIEASIAAGDYLAMVDITDSGSGKVLFSVLESTLSHDSLTDFASGEHFTMLDEDDLVSDSATQAATQQSIKAYVDAASGTQLTQEEVEDYAGALVANVTGTHTGIAITYQDVDGDIDFIVDHDAATNFVANEHIDHTVVTLTAGVGLSGGGDISANRTFTIDLNELTTETGIAAGDFVAMVDITDSGSGKITFANFEAALTHDSLIAGTIAAHDTGATGTELDTLTDTSDADALHTHTGANLTDDIFVLIAGDVMAGALQVDANILIGGSNNELRFYEGANYVGFEAPALTGNQIWVLPIADGGVSEYLQTDGAGNLSWAAGSAISQEQIEDYVGAMVTGNTETLIAVTYQDADGTLDFVVDEANIDHDALTNFVANEHIDWTGASAGFSTTGALIVASINGIDINPGSDIDADLITVGVTGAPKMSWDESDNRFILSKAFLVFDPVNDANPEIGIGSTIDDALYIQAVYDSGAQTLDVVLFNTESSGEGDIAFIAQGNVGFYTSTPDNPVSIIGSVMIAAVEAGDVDNSKMVLGLTINQGANDDEIFALKSSDVAHGITTVTETDTFGYIEKLSATLGGILFEGLTESTQAMKFQGIVTTATTTKTSSSNAAIQLDAGLKSGTDGSAISADGNLLSISSWGTVKLIIDAESTIHLLIGDADAEILKLSSTTGTPTLSWDESADAFKFSKPVRALPIVTSETSSATPTINTDDSDTHRITALAVAITSMTTNLSGTPTHGQKLIVEILDNGTARAITWGASFRATEDALPTTTTVSKLLRVLFMWDSVDSKWDCVAVRNEA